MSDPLSPAVAARRRLAGATIVVTRPAGDARELMTAARAQGAEALALPGLALRATRSAAVVIAQLQTAAHADAWIFSSPAAVRFAFRLLPDLSAARHGPVFGVGAGSARALAGHALHAVIPRERSDSEGLLALPELSDVRGRRLALIGAAGGRDLIASTLRERGATVDEIHVYERVAPRLTQRHFEALGRADDPVIMLLSSAQALAHLVARLPPRLLERLRRQTLVVSSERLAGIAQDEGFVNIVHARSAMPDELLAAAARALAHHRL